MKVAVNPEQGQAVDQVRVGDTIVTKEATQVTAAEGKALLQLQNKNGPLVIKVQGSKKAEEVSDNEAEPEPTEDQS